MKNLFSGLYKWAVIFLVGILVGLVAAIKMIDKSSITNIQTGTYVAGLEQKIGKLKRRKMFWLSGLTKVLLLLMLEM